MTHNTDGSFHFSIEDVWYFRSQARILGYNKLELGWREGDSEPSIVHIHKEEEQCQP